MDVSNGKYFRNMFHGAVAFDYDINWNTSGAYINHDLFEGIIFTPLQDGIGVSSEPQEAVNIWIQDEFMRQFIGNINDWDVSNITNFSSVFSKRHFDRSSLF